VKTTVNIHHDRMKTVLCCRCHHCRRPEWDYCEL